MAKRKSKRPNQGEILRKRRAFLQKLVWAFIIIITILFGYAYGYPIAAQGEVGKGILTGLAYGGGALLAILISLFLNRKLKGL